MCQCVFEVYNNGNIRRVCAFEICKIDTHSIGEMNEIPDMLEVGGSFCPELILILCILTNELFIDFKAIFGSLMI